MRRSILVFFALLALPLAAQQTITPDQLWSAMLQGNQQFVAGKITYDHLKEEREQLQHSQMPPITVLACSDSRVPPELIFNQSLGALFVIREAGSVADEFSVASIEYALKHGYTKLLVVLGHEHCGAVEAALGGDDPITAPLQALVQRIRTSFVGVPYDSRDAANVKKAVEANTRASAASLLASSRVIRDAVITERIKLVTAYYELKTGEVKKLD